MNTTRRVSIALMGVWAVLVVGCVADEELGDKTDSNSLHVVPCAPSLNSNYA